MMLNYSGALLMVSFLVFQSNFVALDGARSVADIVKSRGFVAEEHYVTTSDGYILQVTRVLNPLINGGRSGLSGKVPVLLIHGVTQDGRCFVINSGGARPRDFSRWKVDEISNQLREDPVSSSIAFLASSFGHEVWILNRRGTSGSRGYVDATSGDEIEVGLVEQIFESDPIEEETSLQQLIDGFRSSVNGYWNYSLDEQTKYDFPAVVDYVLNKTSSKTVSVIGHSAGGAIPLMALSSNPKINDKLAQTLLWAPAFYLSNSTFIELTRLIAATNYNGPVLPPTIISLMEGFTDVACQSDTLCIVLAYQQLSLTGNYNFLQHMVKYKLDYIASSSSKELIQLGQSADKRKMYTYDYKDARKNQIAYGQKEPILYDVAEIESNKLSFWYGANDVIAEPEQIRDVMNDLKVPYKERFFNDTGLDFEHESFWLHYNTSTLVIIPSMRVIESN